LWAEASRALLADAADAPFEGQLVRERKVWRLLYAGTEAHVPDSKGMRDLAVLLQRPGTEVHAGELYGTDAADRGAANVDERAREAYRVRLSDLDAELEDADAANDLARAERTRIERDALIDELRRNFDLKGRPRRLGDMGERARKAVTARLRDAIRTIEAAHPALGQHLHATIRTGTFCAYLPTEATAWDVRSA
jgi:hypothetical protein